MNEKELLSMFISCQQKRDLNYEDQSPAEMADTLRFKLFHLELMKNKYKCLEDSLIYKQRNALKLYNNAFQSKEVKEFHEDYLRQRGSTDSCSKDWTSALKVEDLISNLAAQEPPDKEAVDLENHKLLTLLKTAKSPNKIKKRLALVGNINKNINNTKSIIKDNERRSSLPILEDGEEEEEEEELSDEEINKLSFNKRKEYYMRKGQRKGKKHCKKTTVEENDEIQKLSYNKRREFYLKKSPKEFRAAEDEAEACALAHENEVSAFTQNHRKFSMKRPCTNIDLNATNTSTPKEAAFKTASMQHALNEQKKWGNQSHSSEVPGPPTYSSGCAKRALGVGGRRGSVNSKFVPPVKKREVEMEFTSRALRGSYEDDAESPYAELMMDGRLKNIEGKMVELIMNEIMDSGTPVSWDDIAGLQVAKNIIKEVVIWPMLRPDIFTGLRGLPKGILLFGPPGTGKTMIGKCIASQSNATFFSISASCLTSKWVGEGEKMVRALFAVARCHEPSVIFIDEIDSLLSQRSDSEHESSRRIKTEFLVQLDGATSNNDDRVLLVGATNRPQELDEAARRRLVKRMYIPLPDEEAREQIMKNLLCNQSHDLSPGELLEVCKKTEGYSGADMANLCREAALGPIRDLTDITNVQVNQVRPINVKDFMSALNMIRASVSKDDLAGYELWNKKYGITAGK